MRTLITGGTVVTMDAATGDLARGDVLITDGVITGVAGRIDAPDAEIIDATGRIVLPGFVDTHRHTWQTAFRGVGADWTFMQYLVAMHDTVKPHYRPEDVYLGNLLGQLDALNSGITTMLDWFHCALTPEHTDAAVTALRDAPGRSVFGFGAGFRTADPIDDEVRRVRSGLPGDDGANACGLGSRTGSLTPGKDADIILLRADDLSVFPFNNPAGTTVTAGHPGLVETVLVAGRVVKRDGALVGVDVPALQARLLESRDRIAAAAGVALDGTWRPSSDE